MAGRGGTGSGSGVSGLLEAAMAAHRAGRLAEAEDGYRRVLAVAPREADALHLLGVARHQAGMSLEAAELIGRALAVRPAFPSAWNSLGNVLGALGRGGQAVAAYRRALALAPDGAETHGNLGATLLRLGRTGEAERALRQAVALRPEYGEALFNLGNLLRNAGRAPEAVGCYQRALAAEPLHGGALNNLGLTLQELGRGAEAVACFRRLTGVDPANADAWFGLGAALLGCGERAPAVAALARVLGLRPGDGRAAQIAGEVCEGLGRLEEAAGYLGQAAAAGAPEPAERVRLHYAHGVVCQRLGWSPAAAAAYRQALAEDSGWTLAATAEAALNLAAVLLDLKAPADEILALLDRVLARLPLNPIAHLNLGAVLERERRWREATLAYRRALELRPDYAKAHNNLGNTLVGLGRFQEAALHLRRAVEIDPGYAEAYTNLGIALLELDQVGEAIACHRRALALRPELASALSNLGQALETRGDYRESEASLRGALRLDPDSAEALANLGLTFFGGERFDEAERELARALERAPELASAHLGQALTDLLRGRLESGWHHYAWRFAARNTVGREIAVPAWGGEALTGRRLLIWREQGLGDELMFATCYPDAQRVAGAPVLEVSERLVSLFRRSFPGATVHRDGAGDAGGDRGGNNEAGSAVGGGPDAPAAGGEITAADCAVHIGAGSLPGLLRRRLGAFPHLADLLVPEPARVRLWQERLAGLGAGLRVGVCWRSQSRTTRRVTAYTALRDWGPLFALPGIHWIVLQYDDCAQEVAEVRERFGVTLHRWPETDLRNDLETVAALIAGLDLVISGPTVVSEFAGLLGVPCWRIGPRKDWTPLGTAVRPWFPGTRTFIPVAPDQTVRAQPARLARALAALVDAQAHAHALNSTPPTLPPTLPFVTPLPARPTRAARAGAMGPGAMCLGFDQVGLSDHDDRTGAADLPDMVDDTTAIGGIPAATGVAAVPAVVVDPPGRSGLPEQSASLLGEAIAEHRAGRPAEAEARYRRLLTAEPRLAPALRLLGTLLHQEGRDSEAFGVLEQATVVAPGDPVAWAMLARAGQTLGRLQAAEAACRHSLELRPGDLATLNVLAQVLEGLGRADEAEQCLREALAGFGEGGTFVGTRAALGVQARIVGNLGSLLRRRRCLEEAELLLRRAVALDPAWGEGWGNLGVLLGDRQQAVEAEACHRRALALGPVSAAALSHLGVALAAQLRWVEAEACQRQALTLEAEHVDAMVNLALLLEQTRRPGEAIACYRRALAIAPEHAVARHNLGLLLLAGGVLEAGMAGVGARFAVPQLDNPPRYRTLAAWDGMPLEDRCLLVWGEQGIGDELMFASLYPALVRRAGSRRRSGDAVPRHPQPKAERPLETGFCNGPPTTPLSKKGGSGAGQAPDQGAFGGRKPPEIAPPDHAIARGAPPSPVTSGAVGEEAARLHLVCAPRLVALFARSFPWAEVMPLPADPDALAPPGSQLQCPAGALPGLLHARLSELDRAPAVLRADPAAVEGWRRRLASDDAASPSPSAPCLRVGLCWRSGLQTVQRRGSYTRLADWGPVLAVPGVQWVNLQYDRCEQELAAVERRAAVRILRWPALDLKQDLDNAAALISALDLVITAPTATGELSAGLGVPTWRFDLPGTWSALGTSCRPWFPAQRLFSPAPGASIETVLPAIARTLAALVRR